MGGKPARFIIPNYTNAKLFYSGGVSNPTPHPHPNPPPSRGRGPENYCFQHDRGLITFETCRRSRMSDFDSPWKEALDEYFVAFLQFFFPTVHAGVDLQRGYEILDKELEEIVRNAEVGKRLADKLFKVWLPDGAEMWLLIHIEIQSQHDKEFARRMYEYHYRIYDAFRREVISLAVLGDESQSWRPTEFRYNNFNCELSFRFPIVKLLDYQADLEWLETHENPFGLIALTHLQSIATRDNPEDRCDWKIRLAKGLLNRGWDAEPVRKFFKFIDWMMDLPDVLAQQFEQVMTEYEKEKQMPYITTIEQRGIEKGREKGREEGRGEGRRELLFEMLENKFGSLSAEIRDQVFQLSEERVTEIGKLLLTAQSLKDLGLESKAEKT